MSRSQLLLLGLAAATAVACASIHPGSESVVLTRDEAAVKGCKQIGYVESFLSFSFGDARNQLRNQAHGLKADTVLVGSSFGESYGTAYSCAERKP
ncbi:MAG TPA: hypothetical protein VFL12_01770 [Thermoanaerobaculia bacterium]|nr:hypothetical protein [Thermoanaerobaculia bacterium]